MKCRSKILIWLLLFLMTPFPLWADPLYFYGTIGSLPIQAELENKGGELTGWYFYQSQGKQIRLEGKIDPQGNFQLSEFQPSNNLKTGLFQGVKKQGEWSGSWKKAEGGESLPLLLHENRDRLEGLTGEFSCSVKTRDPQFGYIYKKTLHLKIDKGRVKAFQADQASTGHGDQQACSINLNDLKQTTSPAGILLRAGEEGENPQNKPNGACSVRILQGGEFLWVRMGDPSEEGNDCRFSDASAYCSPRAFWNDLLLNFKNRTCKTLD